MYAAAPHIASFELRNFYFVRQLVEDFSIPCDWHSTSGVHAFYSARLFAEVRRAVGRLVDNYPDLAANIELVTKDEEDDSGAGKRGKGDGRGHSHCHSHSGGVPWLLDAERRETTLEGLRVGSAEGAVVQWKAASLWPYKLVAFVLERLLADGQGRFNLQTNTPATGLTSSTPGGGGGGATLWTVHTARGTVTAPRVLLATNAYTSHLLPQFSDLVVPVRGQVSALKPPPPPSSPSADHPHDQPPLDIGHTFYIAGEPDDPYSRDDYLIQRPPPAAELVFGGGRKHARGRGVGVWDDGDIDEPVAWYLRGELGSLVDLSHRPALTSPAAATATAAAGDKKGEEKKTATTTTTTKKQDLEPTYEWTGIMGFSRDGHPWVGEVPTSLGGGRGLAVCAGYTGHGMPNAVLSAKAAVQLLMRSVPEKKNNEAGGEEGDDDEDEEIDLPPEYLLTEDRVAAARLEDEVDVIDAKGSLFLEWGDMRV